jgi:hypothetical protein
MQVERQGTNRLSIGRYKSVTLSLPDLQHPPGEGVPEGQGAERDSVIPVSIFGDAEPWGME